MLEKISDILYKKMQKKCSPDEVLGNLWESISEYVNFLQKFFPKNKANSEDIEAIFLNIIQKINDNWRPELIKRLVFSLLCYIKKEFFMKNNYVCEEMIERIWKNPEMRSYFIEYSNFIIETIYDNNKEPYKEIAFLLFLNWIWNEYNLIYDIRKDNLKWITKLVDNSVERLLKKPDQNNADRFCVILNILNQLTIIQSINAEDKNTWLKIFHEILIGKNKAVIEKFLDSINPEFTKQIAEYPHHYFDYAKMFWDNINEEQRYILFQLQNNLWKFLYNFSSNLEYITIDKNTDKNSISKKIWEIIDDITQWLLYRISTDFWCLEWEKLAKANKRANITTQWNIAFTKLVWLKKLRDIWIDSSEHRKQEIMCIDEFVHIYNNLWTKRKNLWSDVEVIEDFMTLTKPLNDEIIIAHELIIFCEFETELLIRLLDYLLRDENVWNVHFEKFKIKTIEIILAKFSQKLNMCKDNNCNKYECDQKEFTLICNKMIYKIERYIKKNNKENFIYNFWKLYLSIALVYSISEDTKQQEKAKKFYLIFLEKFWNYLPNEVKHITEWIKINLAKFEYINDWINPDWIEKSKLISKWERILSNYTKLFRLEERERLSSWISKMILWIQKNEFEDKKWSWTNIKKEIWRLISETLFNNLCEISIEPKWVQQEIWRFEKITIIENDYFDIIFKYSYIYEDSFLSIFEQVNKHIKDRVIQLIDIYENYASKFQDFKDMTKFVVQIMEKKDNYTSWHVDRVKDLVIAIWKMLWYDDLSLQMLENWATMHDFWKIFVPDEYLTKPWKPTQIEKDSIDSHTWRWIMYWIKEWYNIRILEWMAHHSKWYSPKWNPKLTFPSAIEDLWKKDESKLKDTDYLVFNRLVGKNIPIASRIIAIPDVIDAVASRRVYDKKAWWTTKQIIDHIHNELIICSWLKIDEKWNIYPDEAKWRIANEDELELPYIFLYEWKWYVPYEKIEKNWEMIDNEIQFDPHLALILLWNKSEYKKIQDQIIKTDIALIDKKIEEFSQSIKALLEKKNRYQKIMNAESKIDDELLWTTFVYSENDDKDLQRLLEILPILKEFQKDYKKKRLNITK